MPIVVAEELKLIRTFAELRERAREVGPKRVGVVLADDGVALTASSDALLSRIATPVLIGDEKAIRARAEALGLIELTRRAEFVSASDDAAQIAVSMARGGRIDILMK